VATTSPITSASLRDNRIAFLSAYLDMVRIRRVLTSQQPHQSTNQSFAAMPVENRAAGIEGERVD
jgi:hypothetical protein